MKFVDRIAVLKREPLRAESVKTLQVNIGYRCNMACTHCHVSGGPSRVEVMDEPTVREVIRVVREHKIETLDITGGAPELSPHFRMLVVEARMTGCRVSVRTNLTVFFEQGMTDLPEFFHDHHVDVVASLPGYSEEVVDRVRGSGAFKKSIAALQRLNRLGYGNNAIGADLSLVHNPQSAVAAPDQDLLEKEFKRELDKLFGISFTRLYVFTNMPIGRFGDRLIKTDAYEQYRDRLAGSFNPMTLDRVMCRSLVSVGWDGRLYDCDFNQIIGLAIAPDAPQHVRDFDAALLARRKITMDDHCYGCTAGQGST